MPPCLSRSRPRRPRLGRSRGIAPPSPALVFLLYGRGMPSQQPVAALSANAQIVYASLDPDHVEPAEAIADLVSHSMAAAESWTALQELEAAGRAVQTMGGWTRL